MKKILIILVILIIGGSLGYYFFNRQSDQVITSNLNPSSSPLASVSPDNSSLKMGGSSFSDPEGIYTFLYPNDYTLDTQDKEHIRIYKRGETQRPQSEMSDGALLVVETIDSTGQILDGWVDSYIKQITADGTMQITQPKQAMTINGYPGFIFSLRGLGEAKYYAFQKTANSPIVLIVTSVSDPQNKNYQAEIDATLSTFELIK